MYQSALDLSGNKLNFAVMQDGVLRASCAKPMTGRDSSHLAESIFETIKAAGITPDDIGEWTVGSGPGSFTGLRLAAAFVSGLTLGKSGVRTRVIPGAVALAAGAGVAAGKVIVLYDGRNREILAFGLVRKDGEFVPDGTEAVLDAEAAKAFFRALNGNPALVAAVSDLEAIGKIVPAEVAAKIVPAPEMDMASFIHAKAFPFDGDLTKLVYIRPAVAAK